MPSRFHVRSATCALILGERAYLLEHVPCRHSGLYGILRMNVYMGLSLPVTPSEPRFSPPDVIWPPTVSSHLTLGNSVSNPDSFYSTCSFRNAHAEHGKHAPLLRQAEGGFLYSFLSFPSHSLSLSFFFSFDYMLPTSLLLTLNALLSIRYSNMSG